MTTGASPDSFETPALEQVAAALLRLGSDTKACRLFQSLPPGGSVSDLADALDLPIATRQATVASAVARAKAAVTSAAAYGMTMLGYGLKGYPAWLAEIADPPIVLWVRGDPHILDRPAVAVVGSRRPSAEGTVFAERLGRDLARAGLVVTSGLAYGIDAAAHRGAVDAGLSVAVLGSGPNVVYPRTHLDLADRLSRHGAVVSELPPDTQPRPRHFPLRNRLISGLSRAVVVVEAAERSGSLITARTALEQGRGVCAVPGSVASGRHRGCHALIKDGARLVEKVEDVLEEIGGICPMASGGRPTNILFSSSLEAAMAPGLPVEVDRLEGLSGLEGPALLAELGRLEATGRVRRMPGGLVVRLD